MATGGMNWRGKLGEQKKTRRERALKTLAKCWATEKTAASASPAVSFAIILQSTTTAVNVHLQHVRLRRFIVYGASWEQRQRLIDCNTGARKWRWIQWNQGSKGKRKRARFSKIDLFKSTPSFETSTTTFLVNTVFWVLSFKGFEKSRTTTIYCQVSI